ncbi:MAG: hypothetical protein ABIR46_00535 [Candidatus Saccharimonadales bacterium]
MSTTMASEQTWTAASIDTALVHINTALACLRRSPDGLVDNQTIKEARELKLHLEQNPSACTPDGLVCCCRLLGVSGT